MFVIVIKLMMGQLLQFLIMLVISMLTFASVDHFYFATQKRAASTFYHSFLYRWNLLFGLITVTEKYDYDGDLVDQTVNWIMDSLFALITTTLLMNFLIAILVDMYESVKNEAGVMWCETQAQSLLDMDISGIEALRKKRLRRLQIVAKLGAFMLNKSKQVKAGVYLTDTETVRYELRNAEQESIQKLMRNAEAKKFCDSLLNSASKRHSQETINTATTANFARLKPWQLTGNGESTSNPFHSPKYFKRMLSLIYPEIGFDEAGLHARGRGESCLTMMIALCGLLTQSYTEFTKGDRMPITHEDFHWIRGNLISVINTWQMLDAMFVQLACLNVGTIASFRANMPVDLQSNSMDPDTVLSIAIAKCPYLLPSVDRQGADGRSLIELISSAGFNIGQFLQAENVPASLLGLIRANANDSLGRQLTKVICLTQHIGRLTFSLHLKPVFDSVRSALEVLFDIKTIGATGTYEAFLYNRSQKFSLNLSSQRHILRLCLMLRLPPGNPDNNGVACLLSTFNDLSQDEKECLESELNRSGVDDGMAVMVYFAPNLLQQMYATEKLKEGISFGLKAGLAALARIYSLVRKKLERYNLSGSGVHFVDLKHVVKHQWSAHHLMKAQLDVEFLGLESLVTFFSPRMIVRREKSLQLKLGGSNDKGRQSLAVQTRFSRTYSKINAGKVNEADLCLGNLPKQIKEPMSAKRRSLMSDERGVVVFVDGPDPDNLLCVLSCYHLLCKGQKHLHVVLTGRPADLSASCLTPSLLSKEFERGKNIKELLKSDPAKEVHKPKHSEAVLQDFAERLQQFLESCRVDLDLCTFYHGGIAPINLVSHEMHSRDFLFDRADLGGKGVEGEIMDAGAYWQIVSTLNGMTPDERAERLLNEILREPTQPLKTGAQLQEELLRGDSWVFICGGPFTPVHKILRQGGQDVADRIAAIYGMAGSWDIHKAHNQNMFANQFNFGCDMVAAEALFANKDSTFPTLDCPKFLIPTETCKHPKLCLTPRDMENYVENSFVSLLQYYQLWYDINNKRPFYLFDFSPVFAAVVHATSSLDPLEWIKSECSLNKHGTLMMVEQEGKTSSDDSTKTLLVASRDLSDTCVEKYYEMLTKLCANDQ